MYLELRRIAMQDRGAAARIRTALPDVVRLAWIAGAYALGRARPVDVIEVVVIVYKTRLVAPALEPVERELDRRIRAVAMTSAEWVARFEKRELLVRRVRAGPKLWLRGGFHDLRNMERGVRDARETLRVALRSGELTDDWDEEWDPNDPFPVIRETGGSE